MLSHLRDLVEIRIHQPVTSASVTTIHLAALYREDLEDACEYLGLEYVPLPPRYDILYDTLAAYAGYDLGLCSDYTDREVCKHEQQAMPEVVVMAVLYTRNVLTVTLSITKSAAYLYEPDYRHLEDFSLGHDARTQMDENDYWNSVGLALESIMLENPYYERPAKVLLMGDCVGDENFQRVLLQVLSNQVAEMPDILMEDSENVAAKGAAELAKRAPYDPYQSSILSGF